MVSHLFQWLFELHLHLNGPKDASFNFLQPTRSFVFAAAKSQSLLKAETIKIEIEFRNLSPDNDNHATIEFQTDGKHII